MRRSGRVVAGITPGWAYLPDLPQGHACWGLPAGLTAEAALGALLRECRPRTRLAVLPGGSYGNLSATSTRWVRLLACGLFLSLPCRRMVFPWVAFRLEARVCSAQRPCYWISRPWGIWCGNAGPGPVWQFCRAGRVGICLPHASAGVRLLACGFGGLFLSLPCWHMVFPWVAFRLEARVCSAQRPCRWMRPGSPTSAAAVPPWKYVLTARPDCIAVGWRGGRPQAACPGKGYL